MGYTLTYRPGQRLPSQRDLARQFGVADMTVRQAVVLLERDRLVVRKQGAGTFVMDSTVLPVALVVDDEPGIRALLRAHLQGGGCQVLEAEDGFAAMEIVERETSQKRPVAVVFTDLHMPRMDGVELIRALRYRSPRTVIVAVTGFPDDLSPLGADAWPLLLIAKPFRQSQVRDALALAISGVRSTIGIATPPTNN